MTGRRFAVTFLLLDAPALALAVAFGSAYGFADTYEAVAAWRLEHPLTFVPSVVAAVLFVRRRLRDAGASRQTA